MTREYSPQPGARWQTATRQVEAVVPDGEETRPNRATRRAEAHARRKSKPAAPHPGADTP